MNKNICILIITILVMFSFTICKELDGRLKIDLYRRKDFGSHRLQNYKNNPNVRADRTNDSIALYKYLDSEFYGPIVIGKPGKTMNVAFDTAWALSWVISAKCNTLQIPQCKNHNMYDHTKSSYYKEDGTIYSYESGKFKYAGFFSYENISIAHSNVTGFQFVEMTVLPESVLANMADGVLGLGLKDTSENYEPFFYTLRRQNKIKDPIFSIYLNRDRSSNRGGNVMLGYVEQRHIHKTSYPNGTVKADPIKYLNVMEGSDYWEVAVDKIVVTLDSKNNETLCANGCSAIIDSSTTAIEGPADEIAKIHNKINAKELNNKYYVNCDTVNGLVKVDFVLGGQYFRLNGAQYIIKMSNESTTVCLSAFVPIEVEGFNNTWLIGGAFLAQYYSIYNVEDKTVGFVRAA